MRYLYLIFGFLLSHSVVFGQVNRVAILDFENISGIPKYDGLGKAMSSMLISDIEANVSPKRLQLIERSQVQKILKEQNFQASGSVSKSSVVKAGKLLGVNYLLVGDVYILNDQLIINARLTNTETGEIVFSKKQEGKTLGWLTLKTNIAKDLTSNLSQPFTSPSIPDKETPVATITTYGNAIDAKDKGDINKAENLIETIHEFNPDFKYIDELKEQLSEIKKSLNKLQKTTDEINVKQNTILDGLSNLNSISEDLLRELNPKKVVFTKELKEKINSQLADKDYNSYKNKVLDCYSTVEKIEEQKTSEVFINNIKLLRKEIANKYPNTDIGYFCRAYFEQLNGNISNAVALNDSATAVNPLFWPSYWKNGMILNSLEYLDKAIKAEPNSLIAREFHALYMQVSHPSTDIAFRSNLAKLDYQKCYELTNNIKYKIMECSLYFDFKIWSELCLLVNSDLKSKMIESEYYKQNLPDIASIFTICDNDMNSVNLKDILFDKTKYASNKVLLHLSYESINNYTSNRYDENYYLSILAKGSNKELVDFSDAIGIPIKLYFNKHLFGNNLDLLKKMKKNDIFTVVATIDLKEKYELSANVIWFEPNFKKYDQFNFPEKSSYDCKDGILDLNQFSRKTESCIVDFYNSKNTSIATLLSCHNIKKIQDLSNIYYSDYLMLNNLAWLIADRSNNKSDVSEALYLIEKAVSLSFETVHSILDTYAFILFKCNQKDKSRSYLLKAIELAKNKNDSDAVKKYESRLPQY